MEQFVVVTTTRDPSTAGQTQTHVAGPFASVKEAQVEAKAKQALMKLRKEMGLAPHGEVTSTRVTPLWPARAPEPAPEPEPEPETKTQRVFLACYGGAHGSCPGSENREGILELCWCWCH